MTFEPTPLPGMWIVRTSPQGDARGRLTRLFCADAFAAVRPGLRFVQTNLSETLARGTVRGLHFQRAPALEAKLIRCLRGRVYDVAVDLRAGSPSFGRWHAVELDAEGQRQVFIPEGVAHGFQALSSEVQLLYQHTAAYDPVCEDGVRHDDPALAITWPLPVTVVSVRDRGLGLLDTSFKRVDA